MKSNPKRVVGAAAVLWVLLATGLMAAPLKAGDAAPDLSKYELEGELPASFEGKVVLLDFWASWCAPCKLSFPALNRMQEKYAASGFVVIAVSVDENKKLMEGFLKKHPASFAVVRDGKHKLVAACGVAAMPTSYLIGKDGKVTSVHKGFHPEKTEAELDKEIAELVK